MTTCPLVPEVERYRMLKGLDRGARLYLTSDTGSFGENSAQRIVASSQGALTGLLERFLGALGRRRRVDAGATRRARA